MLIAFADLSGDNVLWGMKSLDSYSIDAKYKVLGRPRKTYIPATTHKPGELVESMKVDAKYLTDNVYLSDFGMAIKEGTSVGYKVQSPIDYCAPERFHNVDPSCASDMWSYMIIFARLYYGCNPFSYFGGTPSFISTLVDVLGPLPQQWRDRYKARGNVEDNWYDPCRKPHPTRMLEKSIEDNRPDASSTERSRALSVMFKGLTYEPERRITAAQLLQDPSFRAITGLNM